MNALEIIQQLKEGRSVVIRPSDAMEFMRQCQFHGAVGIAIHIVFNGQRCTLNDAAKLARGISYRYFAIPFDGSPETLIEIIEDEMSTGGDARQRGPERIK